MADVRQLLDRFLPESPACYYHPVLLSVIVTVKHKILRSQHNVVGLVQDLSLAD